MKRKSTRQKTSSPHAQPHESGDCPDFRAGGDCPDFRASENETAPFKADVEVDVEADIDLAAQFALDMSGAQADRALIDRCIAGEVAAWEDIYRQCHDPLCGSIKALLGPGFHDPNLVDDIAARVWYALVKNDGELLDRFDPCRDLRLGVFFRGLARVELMQHFRAERRRITREAEVGQKPRVRNPLSTNGKSASSWTSSPPP